MKYYCLENLHQNNYYKNSLIHISYEIGLLQFRIVRYLLGVNIDRIFDHCYAGTNEFEGQVEIRRRSDFKEILTQVFKVNQVKVDEYLNLYNQRMKDHNMNHPLNCLPADLERKIFSLLPLKNKIRLRVCQSLKNNKNLLSEDEQLQSCLHKISYQELILFLKEKGYLITELDLCKINSQVDDGTLPEIISFCPNLLSLKIGPGPFSHGNTSAISDVSLASITSLTKLKNLELTYCNQITGKSLIGFASYCQLESLTLHGCNNIKGKNLSLFAHLQNLHLSYCNEITDKSLADFARLSKLKSLKLNRCNKIKGEILSSFSHLQELDLSHFNEINDKSLTFCGSHAQLKSLKLFQCDNIAGKGIALFTQLENLEIAECNKINDESLSCLASLIHLRSLNLKPSRGGWMITSDAITDKGIAYLVSHVQLKTLNLSSCENLTDEGVISLASLIQLKVLNLFGCKKITHSSLATIGDSFAQLQTLDLRFCENITDEALIPITKLKHLKSLNVGWCDKITCQAFPQIAKMTKLEHLYLTSNKEITLTAESVSYLLSLHHLKYLDANGCYKIGFERIDFLRKKGLNVQY